MKQNEHVYAICYRREVGDYTIFGPNVKLSRATFWQILKLLALAVSDIFRNNGDGEVGDGRSDVNAICSRPEVAGDVISCEDKENFQVYDSINLCVANFSSL